MLTWGLVLFLSIYMSLTLMNLENPLNLSIKLVFLTVSLFLFLSLMTSSWFPMILIMLILGGILVIFSILSSLMPNEKMKKESNKLIFFSLFLLFFFSSPKLGVISVFKMNKSFIEELPGFSMIMVLMLFYFFSFIYVLSMEETSMRKFLCFQKKEFCKFLSNKAILLMKRKEINILKNLNSMIWDLPSPSSLSYFWNLGASLGICLLIQLLTGLFLSFHYSSESTESFSSVISIMKEVWAGWLIRFVHMNGASLFFFLIYVHMSRGLFFFSSMHKKVWSSGVSILILLMAVSFMGYVLPWGQMSYWAVAVITNLFSIVPILGSDLVNWIWGGFSVSAPTLNRFYSFHFFLPFILMFFVILHLIFLHENGSSNSLGLKSNVDKLSFHPYFSIKDGFFIGFIIVVSLMVSFFSPFILGDAVNNVPANPMQTPIHIQPEWYFLPSYAILRAMPSKATGVLALSLSVGIFYLLPLFSSKFSSKFSSVRIFNFWLILTSFLFLMLMGASPAEEPFISMSKFWSMLYFSSILCLNI